MNFLKLLKNGIVDENPIFVQLLALCPLLAVTTSALNALTMGLSTTTVMVCACAVISILRRLIPSEIRIAAYILIVATFVTILQFVLQAFAPALNDALGIFIALIVVNCIVLARIEAFASKNKLVPSIVDAFGMGLGFTVGLLTLGIVREFLGTGSIFGLVLVNHPAFNMLIFIMAPGAFFTLGVVIMVRKHIMSRSKK